MVDQLFRDAAQLAAPWCGSDEWQHLEDSIQSGEFEGAKTMTPYQLGYAATNAETHDKADALYLKVCKQGHRAQVEFYHGAKDARLDIDLCEGKVAAGSQTNWHYVLIQQAQYLF